MGSVLAAPHQNKTKTKPQLSNIHVTSMSLALPLSSRRAAWVLQVAKLPAALPADLQCLPHGSTHRADCCAGDRSQHGANDLRRRVLVLAVTVCESGRV